MAPASAAATILLSDKSRIDNPRAHHLGHSGGHERPGHIEHTGRHNRHKRAHDSRGDHGRNGVGTVMPPVRKVEQECQHHHNEQHSSQLRHDPSVRRET